MLAYYRIAGLIVQMDSFGRTVRQAQPYAVDTDEAPQIVISSNLPFVRKLMPQLSEDDCEYLATGDSFYRQLLSFDGMMLHASAVEMDGKAYLFSAPCGTGKSTHTALWQRVFGSSRAVILNDDKPALRWDGQRLLACGTPWSGKNDLSRNDCVPVAGICFLSRGEVNAIRPFGGKDAIHALLDQTVRPSDPALAGKLLTVLDLILTHTRVWSMTCNMEPEAALVSHAAMSGEKE